MRSVRRLVGVFFIIFLIGSERERFAVSQNLVSDDTGVQQMAAVALRGVSMKPLHASGMVGSMSSGLEAAGRFDGLRAAAFQRLTAEPVAVLDFSFSGGDEQDAVGFFRPAFVSRLPVISGVSQPSTRAFPGVAPVLLIVPRL